MQVPAGLATESSSVRLFVCQDGDCRRISFQLRPSPAMVDKGCNTDGVCTARASPTGRRHGFGTLPELTTSRARIQLALRAPSGKAVLERRVSAKPEMVYPNGRSCSGQAPQLQLQITGDGGIRVG